jgi:hypothetical protein
MTVTATHKIFFTKKLTFLALKGGVHVQEWPMGGGKKSRGRRGKEGKKCPL